MKREQIRKQKNKIGLTPIEKFKVAQFGPKEAKERGPNSNGTKQWPAAFMGRNSKDFGNRKISFGENKNCQHRIGEYCRPITSTDELMLLNSVLDGLPLSSRLHYAIFICFIVFLQFALIFS